jgi:membrane fusion protein (multidrug efflux system)
MSDVAVGRDVADSVARTRMLTRRLLLAVLVVTACLGAAWLGADWWRNGRFIETTDDAYVGGDITQISPHVAGFVSAILVADNAHVQAGALLVRLDARDYQAALDHAQAAVAAQAGTIASLQAQLIQQQSAIDQTAADLAAKSARARFTQIDNVRYAALSVTRAGSIQDADRSRVANQEAEAAVMAARAGMEAARQRVPVFQAELVAAQGRLAQARADMARARLDMGYTDIRAPIEGFVGNRAAQAGAYVQAGSYLLSVIPAHGLWVDANFKEDQLARMAPGQIATFTADAAPGKVFHGRVVSVAPGTGAVFSVIPPENATGNFTKIVQRVPVRIALDADNAALARLRPGLSVLVSVDARTAP